MKKKVSRHNAKPSTWKHVQYKLERTKLNTHYLHGVLVQYFVSGQTCCVSSDNGE